MSSFQKVQIHFKLEWEKDVALRLFASTVTSLPLVDYKDNQNKYKERSTKKVWSSPFNLTFGEVANFSIAETFASDMNSFFTTYIEYFKL